MVALRGGVDEWSAARRLSAPSKGTLNWMVRSYTDLSINLGIHHSTIFPVLYPETNRPIDESHPF
jgi:hypothetical protein